MTGLLLLDHRQVLLEKLGTIGLEAHHLHLDQHLVVLSAEREGERERERERSGREGHHDGQKPDAQGRTLVSASVSYAWRTP